MTDAPFINRKKIDPTMAAAIENGTIRIFEDFPCLAGITTNSMGTFQKWPRAVVGQGERQETEKVDYGPCTDDSENHFFSSGFGCDVFLKIAPAHGARIKMILPGQVEKSDYIPRDGIIQIESMVYRRDNAPELALLCNTADCPIVVLYAEGRGYKARAIVHCGWRGIKGGILHSAIETLAQSFELSNIHIGIWAGICGDCYEVKKDVARFFPNRYMHEHKLNLKNVILRQIARIGILREKIRIMDDCSHHTQDENGHVFCSHRRDGAPERNLVFIT